MRRPSRDLDFDARWAIGLLALVVLAVYGNSLLNGFGWDDLSGVVGN
ncbi:MAG: hypothetical protein OEM05_15725 [Myxococcales bacterium]|nr:hypothetical protein [Myxococcales bacterium]